MFYIEKRQRYYWFAVLLVVSLTMMNRRARIKGIANIPVRRKNETTSENNIKSESTVSPEQVQVENKSETNESEPEQLKVERKPETNKDSVDNRLQEIDINKTESSENHEPIQQISPSNNINNKSESITDECQNIASSETNDVISESDNKSDVNINSESNNTSTNQIVSRRWIPKPKPMVKNPTMLRRPKPVLLPLKEKAESVINQNIENEKPLTPQSTEEIKSPPVIQISVPENLDKQSTPNESILKSPTDPDRMLTSPLSPNKILNRSRIRPTPKLIRRNSVQGSASESEDDGRRSRIRNDSVCSTASYSTEIVTVKENTIISKDKVISIKVHKLFRRSEQSRKVAEARRDFYQKFGTKTPDRKRLTMMDLIYYNPISNPMPPRKQNTTTEEIIIPPEPEKVEEEEMKEDDPEEIEEEDSNPVPQVKVGPNGEIILDEQSLVIEQTGTKKGRELLANSQVVNVDDLDRAYGIYKRPKRAKDWSAIETLRFYRSLNTVGTDFSLMVSLFPGRTRRELKMKFKKEEKINRQLIDKALTNPLDFDLSELEKQLQEEEEIIKKMEEEGKQKKPSKPRPKPVRRKFKGSLLAYQMDEENEDDPSIEKTVKVLRPRRTPKPKKDRYSALHISELSTSDSESENESPRKMFKTIQGKTPVKENVRKRDSHKANSKDYVNVLLKEEKSSQKEQNNNENDKTNDVSLEKSFDQLLEETVDEHLDETIDEHLEKTIDEHLEETIDEHLEETIDEHLEETIDEHLEETIDEHLEETIDEHLEETIECEDNEMTENFPENDQNCVVPNILPNDLSTVEPGSLMILSSTGPDGQQIFKVFMVTPGQAKVPVNLSEDVVQSLTTSLGSAQAVTLDLPVINEMENQVISSDSI